MQKVSLGCIGLVSYFVPLLQSPMKWGWLVAGEDILRDMDRVLYAPNMLDQCSSHTWEITVNYNNPITVPWECSNLCQGPGTEF